jgi:hypothetical protein
MACLSNNKDEETIKELVEEETWCEAFKLQWKELSDEDSARSFNSCS